MQSMHTYIMQKQTFILNAIYRNCNYGQDSAVGDFKFEVH